MTDSIAKLETSKTAAPSPLASAPAAVNAQAPDHDTLARLMHAGVLRPKLKIGGANDSEERDADCMADRAVNGDGACCDSCEKDGSSPEAIRMKPVGSESAAARGGVSVADSIVGGLGSGEPLNPRLKSLFQPSFRRNLSGVRLHTDTNAQSAAAAIGARAFAVGGNIAFGPGQFQPETRDGQRLLAHELAHVAMGHSGIRRNGIADEAIPTNAHQSGSSRAVSLRELHDILVELLTSLKRRTQLSVRGWKAIAVGLVEGVDEKGAAFQTLVYTASGNWKNVDLESQAAALGITRWIVGARDVGRGAAGAPGDAEQRMIDGQDEADMRLLGMAVSRDPCLDCVEAIRDEDVKTVFVDPAKHLPKRERRRKVKPSAQLEGARAEIAQAFGPQVVARGQEVTAGLGAKASIWNALNVLNMPELYQALEEADRAGRLSAIAAKAPKAEGVDNNRILAPGDAIFLKKENLKQTPEVLMQAVVSSLLTERLALLPPDQSSFILRQLYPGLRLATPPKLTTPSQQREKSPKSESPAEKAKESSSFVSGMIKALAALGVTAAAIDAVANTLVAIAGEIFTNVVLRIIVDRAAKVPVREAIKKVVETAVKDSGPKLRVLGETVRQRLPDVIADELTHVVEQMTHSYIAAP
jgi:hypothetical protein